MVTLQQVIKQNTTGRDSKTGLIKCYEHYCHLSIEGINYAFMTPISGDRVTIIFRFKNIPYVERIGTASNREEFRQVVKEFIETYLVGLNLEETEDQFIKEINGVVA